MATAEGDFLIINEGTWADFVHTFNGMTEQQSEQADMLANADGWPAAWIAYDFTMVGTPTAGESVGLYLIRRLGGSAGIADDGAGSSAATWPASGLPRQATKLRTIGLAAVASDRCKGVLETSPFGALGSEWTIGVHVNTATVDLHGTAGNVLFKYQYYRPQVQF